MGLIQDTDDGWLIVTGAMIFLMQCGFCMLEVGSVRVKSTKSILLKTLLDNCITAVMWLFVGYAFAFGTDESERTNLDQFMGYHCFVMVDCDRYAYWFFQWAFASATIKIVSGAIAERTQFMAYFFNVVVMSAWTYPIIAHWVWGGGWLSRYQTNGFLDFAGSGVVHITGGATSLVAAWIVGPRIGRFDKNGKPKPLPGYSKSLICLGVFILWFGWYGFNPGSTLALSKGLYKISSRAAATTTIAASSGFMTCTILSRIIFKQYDVVFALNGILAGLVSITGGCAFVDLWAAVIIGVVGACVFAVASKGLLLLRIDDPVDASPVHLFCGIWGIIANGLFARREQIEILYGPTNQWGAFLGGGGWQLAVQLAGMSAILGWSSFFAFVVFGLCKVLGVLRVPEKSELKLNRDKNPGPDSYARVEIMDNGRLDHFQFRIT
eukprot:TRINITY_DN7842_c0_g1_i1.p1 TRINITY_DN7842_c0_g1~~TRINITY_DN7842_c0_g1_i1.p1  ORF type:complete len:437 (+),score=55.74 TRINITY_DN7842_c0_g1_i1:48-1358(+)